MAATPAMTRSWSGRVTALVLLLVMFALLLLAEPMRVGSASMAPTLQPGDQVVVDKITPRLLTPQRMDVVAASAPHSRLTLVKRVVGVGGDTVSIEDGLLHVNGKLVAEKYVDHDLMDGVYFGPIVVPRGTVFLLGDNRSTSIDSRAFGPVPEASVRGQVRVRWWPPLWITNQR